MEIRESFVVPVPAPRVWDYFGEVERIVECMPGASIVEVKSETEFRGKLTVAVGPVRPNFDVAATVERDDAMRTGRVVVLANDARGGSRADGVLSYRVDAADGDGAEVSLVQDVTLAGPIAQFGRTGIVESVSRELTRQFAACLESKLAAPGEGASAADAPAPASGAPASPPPAPEAAAAKPVSGLRLLRVVLGDLLRRITGRPR